MRRGIVLLFGFVVAGFFANAALATATDPLGGFVEICKTSAPAPNAVTGAFEFHDRRRGRHGDYVHLLGECVGGPL